MKYVSEIFKINVKLCPRSHLLSPVQRIILAASAPVWHHSDVDLNILSYPAPPLLYCSWLSLPPMNFIDIRFISLQSKSNIFGKDRSQDRSCDVQTLCLQCSISYRGKKSFLCKSRDFGGNVFCREIALCPVGHFILSHPVHTLIITINTNTVCHHQRRMHLCSPFSGGC